ncbi:hypothetical protein CVD25_08795 [Bacillus canaveralius]|uniref:SpoVT-AbrB domain-containing protein n=1 Tax=Bacillus canaveralius TaxID=1403243 RepID=A0A2N5GL30_9BACI|nr:MULTISPECIES: AbrB/MazE/SpoVT family DNA-binding domain-containing protein [Bacillus]PLR82180.1 hypothetical protein CU635_13545 [Bacillus canaveralius]PLR84008.1 hypothetical protein CVD23_12765 [Bacillus sp. V33-4]PLR97914.1 hypothetical protein CVD25_08795 [Bacillus canaveralius]
MYVRRISKKGQICIPKKIQTKLSILEGDYLYIYIKYSNIIIEKHNDNQTLNQCVIRNGQISIPAEIRRILGISYDTPLVIDASGLQKKIILKPQKKLCY